MTSLLSTDFEQVSYALPASQREELAKYIYFLQENDEFAKNNAALSKIIWKHSAGSINWPDVSISKFKNTQSSFFLPEGEQKQGYLFQILKDRAMDHGYGEAPVFPPYEGQDPELFFELVKIFGLKEDNTDRRTHIAMSDFINEFKDHTQLPINIDRVRSFIDAKGSKEHKFPTNVREALLKFTRDLNNGEIKIRTNVLFHENKIKTQNFYLVG